ncbi:MAG TPA: hypothetical protein VMI75_29205 [Polyangiaceae bacterium]|nr:hypothetical protein [Polyangiaceae bacterium]
MRRRALVVVALLATAAGASACALLVDVGDHALLVEPGIDASESGGNHPGDSSSGDVSVGGDASIDGGAAADAPAAVDAASEGGVVVLASGLQRPNAIWGDANNLYWIAEETASQPGAVMAMPKAGGTPITLVSDLQRPVAVKTSASTPVVYFTADGVHDSGVPGMFAVGKDGGVVTAVDTSVDGLRFDALAVAGLAFTEASDVDGGPSRLRITFAGGTPSCYPYETGPGGRIPAIAADSTNIYIVDTSLPGLVAVGRSCDAGATVIAGGQQALTVSYDTADYFWLTSSAALRLAKTPDASPLVVAANLNDAQAMTFPSVNGAYIACADGTIWHVQYPTLTKVADGQDDPSSILIDATGTAYWTNRGSGQVVTAHY